jgi:cytochrome c biogenesis protein CcmG/thiol:disulfide interchange protein DsbE
VSRIAAGGLLLVLALLTALFAWRLTSGQDPSTLPSALVGEPVRPFALPPLPGRQTFGATDGLALADLKTGGVHVVNFFASWCISCRQEAEALMHLAVRSDIQVVGIDYKDDPKAGLAYLAAFGDPYGRIGLDRDGRVAIDWGVYGVPETFVVSRSGQVVARLAEPLTTENFERVLLPAIAKAKRAP